jgi:hypothetical protein
LLPQEAELRGKCEDAARRMWMGRWAAAAAAAKDARLQRQREDAALAAADASMGRGRQSKRRLGALSAAAAAAEMELLQLLPGERQVGSGVGCCTNAQLVKHARAAWCTGQPCILLLGMVGVCALLLCSIEHKDLRHSCNHKQYQAALLIVGLVVCLFCCCRRSAHAVPAAATRQRWLTSAQHQWPSCWQQHWPACQLMRSQRATPHLAPSCCLHWHATAAAWLQEVLLQLVVWLLV